jgi:hypothetical protein
MSIIGLSMATLPCCAKEDVEAGSAALRVDWPVYPRRAEHNTVAEGGNRRWAETCPSECVPIALAEADPSAPAIERVMLVNPAGLGNWQMTQRTAFEIRNKTGSDVFIAASTMAG